MGGQDFGPIRGEIGALFGRLLAFGNSLKRNRQQVLYFLVDVFGLVLRVQD